MRTTVLDKRRCCDKGFLFPPLPAPFALMPCSLLCATLLLLYPVSNGSTPVPGYERVEGCSRLILFASPHPAQLCARRFHCFSTANAARCTLLSGVNYSPSSSTPCIKCNLFSNLTAVAGLTTRLPRSAALGKNSLLRLKLRVPDTAWSSGAVPAPSVRSDPTWLWLGCEG